MSYFKDLGVKLTIAFQRFPLTFVWVIIGCIHYIIAIEDRTLFEESYRLDSIFILGISWLIGTQFLIEQFKRAKKFQWLKLVVLILLAAFYWTLPKDNNDATVGIIRLLLYLLAGHIFIFFAPFIKLWDKTAFWNYLKNVIIAIGRSILFSGILYLGVILAYAAVVMLFDLEGQDNIYGYLFILCLGGVNTSIYLSDFPKNIQENRTLKINKPIVVLVKYILTPLLALYFIILYAYSIKILFTWELPTGWVSGLVTTLALLGFVIQIIINPFEKEHSSPLIRKFQPWFYILLLPLLLLLFIAVFRRIEDYGFTEERYFLLLLSFWILGITLYFLFQKNRQVRVLPISLFLLLLLSSLGPWSAFTISLQSQTKEFKAIYSQYAEEELWNLESTNRMSSILNYLQDRGKLDELTPLLGYNPEREFSDVPDYLLPKKIMDSLSITYDGARFRYNNSYFSFNSYSTSIFAPIKDYAQFYFLQFNSYNQEQDSIVALTIENGIFKFQKNGKSLLQLDLKEEIMQQINKNYQLDKSKFIFEKTNEQGKFKIVFKSLSLQIKKEKIITLQAELFLFYHPKKQKETKTILLK